MSNFSEKANHFSALFASKCRPIQNNSTLPVVTTRVTNASLSSTLFNDQDILKIIHSLNINKTHDDDISIRLLRICDSSVVRPPSIIFKNCLQSGSFSNNWKKEGHKQLLQTIGLFLFCQYVIKF